MYFNQIIQLKNDRRNHIFKKETEATMIFEVEGIVVEIPKDNLQKEDIILVWETVKLFGKVPMKRIARA